MKRYFALLAVAAALSIGTPTALAANPGTQGQPTQSCQDVFPTGPMTPNGFNTSGFAHAEEVYAGSAPQNSNNPHSVSQYDVACFQTSMH